MTDSNDSQPPATDSALELEQLRERALAALREGRFDLAEDLLANDDVNLSALIENVRIYQAELEIQNEELTRSQAAASEALERFTALFQSTPIAELVIDRHGLILSANPAASELFALRDLRVHHHFLLRLVSERDRGGFLDLLRQLTQSQQQHANRPELKFMTTDGHEFFGDLHGARLPDAADGELRMLCAIVDRTAIVQHQRELRQAYDRLASSQEAYHVLTEYSPDWDYWISPEGQFIHVSPGCRKVTGYGAQAFLDDPQLVERLLHPDDRPTWRAHLESALTHGADDEHRLLLRLQHRDGGWRWIEHECRAVIADDGRYLGRRGVNRDVTKRHEMEESVRELRNMLVDAERIAKAGAWSWEIDQDLIQVSPGWQRILGADRSAYSCAELSEQFAHPQERKRLEAVARRARTQCKGCDLEHRVRRASDGATRWFHTRAEVVKDTNGKARTVRGTSVDISAVIKAKTQLQESEQRFRALFESAAEGMLVLQDARFIEVNQAALRMLGYEETDADAVIGKRPDELSPPMQPDGTSSQAKAEQLARQAAGKTLRFDWQHQQRDGTPLLVEVIQVPIELEGEPAYFVHWLDRTEEVKARQRERQATTVFENSTDAILFTDAEQRILAVNRAFSEITGYTEAEVLNETPKRLGSGYHDDDFFTRMWQESETTGSWYGEIWNRRKNGEMYPVRLSITSVKDDDGQLINYIGMFSDVSEIKRSEEELYRLAHHDVLTGLPNRTLLRARMEQSLQRAKRDHRMLALLFIDLDLFKNVNDSLGHSVGDELLKEVASAIEQEVRKADTVARIGGDEFVILMDGIDDPATAAHLAERLCQLVSQPFQVADRELRLTASIGVSLFPDDGKSMESLLSNADLAMYRAKDQGRNTYRFFEAEMTARAMQRLHLETALRGALARHELELVYQPQFELKSGHIHGAEALLRWTHPELGRVSPADFIPIAEEIGLISEIGAWVLEQACVQLQAWEAQGFSLKRIAVNVSVQQVERLDLVDEIRAILKRTGVAPERLELEVTESLLMRNVEQVITSLNALRELGISLAIDDFGSGFSSLGYLKKLPISHLKIDKTFVDGVTIDEDDNAIARAIIALGRALRLAVIAEGVETQVQADFLKREGCEEVQGYLFGRPMSADALRQFAADMRASV